MAERLRRFWLLTTLLPVAAGAAGDPPDAAFLEYLGSWETGDEDWQLFAAGARDRAVTDDMDHGNDRCDDAALPRQDLEQDDES